MKRSRFTVTLVAAIGALIIGAQANPAAPYTPAADLKGQWSFDPDPALPNVLIIGDSISIAYTLAVRELLKEQANVHRPLKDDGKGPENSGDTIIGLANLDRWLGDREWSLIHFNWGLWDLCYRNKSVTVNGGRDKVNGTLSVTLEDYETNLNELVARLKATGAKLVWANTTVVPEGESGRFAGDEVNYNAVAGRVMAAHGIPVNDLHATSKEFPADHFVRPGDVHFSAKGNAKLAAKVAAEIRKLLE